MAELGLFQVTVFKDNSATDTRQVPATSISVAVHFEGAWANGSGTIADTASGTITVRDIGSFTTSSPNNSVQIGTTSGVTGTVTAITATTLTVTASGGTLTWSDEDRVVSIGALVMYKDDQGAETKTNALTTDSTTGRAWGYVDEEAVDYIISGTGVTTTLISDHSTHRANQVKSNAIDSATAIAFEVDTHRTFSTAGAKLLSLATGGSEKYSVDKTGGFTAATASTVTAGGLTISAGGTTITGNSTITGTLGGLTGLTVASGGAAITGNITVNNAIVHGTITALVDDATPTVLNRNVFLTGGTTTITDFDDGVEGQFIVVISEHAVTITDGTNIFLNGSANFVMAATDTLTLVQKADGKWYETARSVN